MLALIAGTGDLPAAVLGSRTDVVVCAMQGFPPVVPVDMTFRIEHLGGFLDQLIARGVTEVCFAGAIKRPIIDPAEVGPDTAPLIAVILDAIRKGDDGALRAIIGIFEARGLTVVAAHDLARHLLPVAGVLTTARPDADIMRAAVVGERVITRLGALDQGQACVIGPSDVLAEEGPEGTDAMLSALSGATDAVLYKAPKPDQDRRADLPVIGPATATAAAKAGLRAIAIEAGGVMVLDAASVTRILDDHGMVLWVRPRTES